MIKQEYTTAEIAELFGVSHPTVTHWRSKGAIKECRIEKPTKYIFSRETLVQFVKDTHKGKYKNSPLDIFPVLESLGMEESDLPETKRFTSWNYVMRHQPIRKPDPEDNRPLAGEIDLSKNKLTDFVISDTKHKEVKSMTAYFRAIAKISYK